MPLLGVRILALFFATALARTPGRRASLALAVTGASFVVSLVVRELWPVEVFVAGVAVERLAPRWPGWLRGGALVATLVFGFAGLTTRAPHDMPTVPSQAPQAVDYWRGRSNLFHARVEALRWAQSESPPGEGYLALAEVDWELGDRARAEKVLAKVIDRATSESVKGRAVALSEQWKTSRP